MLPAENERQVEAFLEVIQVAAHDLHRDVGQALGVGLLRGALERAVDEDGTQPAEIEID